MKKIDVLIYYEHVARELQSVLLLKKELEKYNLKVIVYKIRWNETLTHLRYRPKIIVTPWCYGSDEVNYIKKMWIGSFPKKNIKIVCLNWEQLSGQSGQKFVVPKGEAKKVIHFAWGNYFKKLLIEDGVANENVYVTGSISNDFYKKPYSLVNLKKEELARKFYLDFNKKWVLLIGNFSGKNLTGDQLDTAERKGFSSIRKLSELAKTTFNELIKWYDEAAQKNQDLEFIYRPHPNENITNDILEVEKKNKNFHIIKELPIREWIVNCDISYEWFSTSAVEVSFSDKPVFSLMPYEMPKELVIPLIDKVEKLKNKEEFFDNIKKFKNGSIKEFNVEFKKEVEFYYSNTCASVKCAEIINNLLSNNIGFMKSNYDFIGGLICSFRFICKIILLKFGIMPRNTTETVLNDVKQSKKSCEYEERIKKIDNVEKN